MASTIIKSSKVPMKFLTVTLFLFTACPVMAGICKISNNITKKNGDIVSHSTSKKRVFSTDLSGCLKIAQHNFMSIEHKLQKGYYYVGSAGIYYEISDSKVREKDSFFIRASNITEPKENKCEAVYTKEKKFFGGIPVPIKIIEVVDEQTSQDPVEECIAKTSSAYLKAIGSGKFEALTVNTILNSRTGEPFEVIIYGPKNISGFKRIITPIIQKINH
jgi:hypothetical protein